MLEGEKEIRRRIAYFVAEAACRVFDVPGSNEEAAHLARIIMTRNRKNTADPGPDWNPEQSVKKDGGCDGNTG